MAYTLHPDTPLSSFPALAPGHHLPSSSPCGLLSQEALPDHSGRVRSAVLTGTRPLSVEQETGCAHPGRKPCLSLLSGRSPWALPVPEAASLFRSPALLPTGSTSAYTCWGGEPSAPWPGPHSPPPRPGPLPFHAPGAQTTAWRPPGHSLTRSLTLHGAGHLLGG